MHRERLPTKTAQWYGQPVHRVSGSLAEIDGGLPTFSRQPLVHEHALNEYLDLILREPEPEDDRRVPVSTVSRSYALIQHTDAVAWLRAAFDEQGWAADKVGVTVWLSEYGERMRAELVLPVAPIEIAPGDALQAEVCVWNSVDRSRAFEVAIRWQRLVCRNGLAVWEEDRLRVIHLPEWLRRASPVEFLRERLPKSTKRTATLQRWLDAPVSARRLVQWIDESVAARWGKGRAARVLHIARTGHDCAVGRAAKDTPSSKLETVSGGRVPGAPEHSGNVYDLYQALLWVSGAERSVEQREAMANAALPLIQELLPQHLRTESD